MVTRPSPRRGVRVFNVRSTAVARDGTNQIRQGFILATDVPKFELLEGGGLNGLKG